MFQLCLARSVTSLSTNHYLVLIRALANIFFSIYKKIKNITGNKHLEIIAEKNFKPGGSRANQATSYDIENTSLHKPSNIIQIQQQDTESAIISERNS